MKKVLQLNVTANWGSTGKIAEGIGQAAINRGWESYIAFGREYNQSVSKLIKVGSPLDVYFHYARSRFFNREGFGSRNATKQLIKQIINIGPDIIQLHNIHDHWLNYPLLFRYLATINTPVFWTFHDCWSFTGGCFITGSNCDKWKILCEECPIDNSFIANTINNYLNKKELFNSLSGRLRIISVSKWLDSLVSKSFLSNNSHTVIHNGVDTELFRPSYDPSLKASLGLDGKSVLLGVSNVWAHHKGLIDFIELRKLLPDEYVIVLVGLKSDEIKSLPTGIIGIERTDSIETLAHLYSIANFVVSLSRAETFGMTLAEGLACGTPCISYGSSGTQEVISNDTGFLIQQGDVKAISEILRYKPVFDSDICRQRALKLFDKDTQFNKYIDLYDSIFQS